MSLKRVLFITGPTSSGKTSLALALAKRFNGEVVNADARQVFHDAPIGTGVPAGEWKGLGTKDVYFVDGVPHHLMAVSGPNEAWTVSSWTEAANACLEEIWARDALPMVVGGTGLYIRALSEGYVFSGEPDEALRNALLKQSPADRLAQLLELFPEAGRSIDLKNPHRVLRALEKLRSGSGIEPTVVPPAFQSLKLAPSWESDALKARLEQSVSRQFASGWLGEVRRLLERDVSSDAPLMRSIGFRTIAEGISELVPEDALKERVVRETWQYARRQMTWLRKEPNLKWIKDEEEGMALVERWLQ